MAVVAGHAEVIRGRTVVIVTLVSVAVDMISCTFFSALLSSL
jgi:hypothetical protein